MTDTNTPSILVVDDDEILRDYVLHILREQGFAVSTAGNGCEALAVMEASPADVVLTDVFMPEMDGIETILAISERWPRAAVVVMSGGAKAIDAETAIHLAMSLGARRSLSKPFSEGELLDVVNMALVVRRAAA